MAWQASQDSPFGTWSERWQINDAKLMTLRLEGLGSQATVPVPFDIRFEIFGICRSQLI